MSLTCYQEVLNDLESIFEYEETYDVIFYAGEDANEIYAHSLILRTRSSYFRRAFLNEWIMKREDGKYIFRIPNIHPRVFRTILRFIYCGKVDLTKLQGPEEVLDLLIALKEFDIQTLIYYIQEYLIKYQDEFLMQNITRILEMINQYGTFKDLWSYCIDKICERPDILFYSNQFINLKASLLESLLKRDDLLLDEVTIWNGLIAWCLAQHPNISREFSTWNEQETIFIKNTIGRFIPFVRFYEIPSNDFISKVYPLKDIIPKYIINDVMTFHISISSSANNHSTSNTETANAEPSETFSKCYDSVIIKPKHFAIFASWIEKIHFNVRNLPYYFSLLYRASRDGYTSAAFHEKCDNKGATIVVAKILNSDQIVGGHNPLFWDKNDNTIKSTSESFIFSFKNKNNFQSSKVRYSDDDLDPIYYDPNNGPAFGNDLVCLNNSIWESKPLCYPKIDVPAIFNVDDYEVFQVIKRRN